MAYGQRVPSNNFSLLYTDKQNSNLSDNNSILDFTSTGTLPSIFSTLSCPNFYENEIIRVKLLLERSKVPNKERLPRDGEEYLLLACCPEETPSLVGQRSDAMAFSANKIIWNFVDANLVHSTTCSTRLESINQTVIT